ncbi:MAG: hypothetical protein E7Z88_05435 [Cyanobacteria bacterium SIG27]|nr:hypothetical protein [Cyanobacteria bacterium SIG27]
MNIARTNISKINFGKISWGNSKQSAETSKALAILKERNDIYNDNEVRYSDVAKQLQILADHEDTFLVCCKQANEDDLCTIGTDQNSNLFVVDVYENDGKTRLDSFARRYASPDSRVIINGRFTRSKIDEFAQNVLKYHQSAKIKSDVETLMQRLGKVCKK